jgi:hypothetical protein
MKSPKSLPKPRPRRNKLKTTALVLLVVGVTLGIGQIFVRYDRTFITKIQAPSPNEIGCLSLSPECVGCGDQEVNGYCIIKDTKPVRGFPLSSSGSGKDYKTNQKIGLQHMINLLIFILPGSLLLAFAIRSQRTK